MLRAARWSGSRGPDGESAAGTGGVATGESVGDSARVADRESTHGVAATGTGGREVP